MLRRISFAELDVTGAPKLGRIHGLAATSGRCRPVEGGVNLKIPKLRRQTFENCDYRTLPAEQELGRGGVDRDVSGPAFRCGAWRTYGSPLGHAGEPEHGVQPQQEDLRNRRIEGEHPYLYLDGIVMKCTVGRRSRNVALQVAGAVNSEGFSGDAESVQTTGTTSQPPNPLPAK